MLLYVSIIHYILLIIVLWQAIDLLKKLRGNSILAIYATAFATQVGIGWGYYLLYVAPTVDAAISEEVLLRMGVSLCITSSVFIMAIVFFKMRMPLIRPMAADGLELSKEMAAILCLCVVAFIALLLVSPVSRHVIEHGVDVLGGEGYYEVRGELIQVRSDAQSGRLEHRFMRMTYALLLLCGLVFLYKYSLTKRFSLLAIGSLFAAVPLLQALLSFQKGPIVTISCVFFAALLLFYKKEGRVRIRWKGAFVAGTITLLMASMSYMFFQGMGAGDAGGNVLRRIFVVPINTSAMHHAVYPDFHPFVKFGDMGMVRQFSPIGVGHVPIYGSMAREVALTLRGLDYNANTGIVGHGWGTWGHFGVFLFTSSVAILFSFIDRFTATRRHLASVAPLTIYYWFFFLIYGNGNLHTMLSTSSLFIIPFVYFWIFAKRGDRVNSRGSVEGRPPEARRQHTMRGMPRERSVGRLGV